MELTAPELLVLVQWYEGRMQSAMATLPSQAESHRRVLSLQARLATFQAALAAKEDLPAGSAAPTILLPPTR